MKEILNVKACDISNVDVNDLISNINHCSNLLYLSAALISQWHQESKEKVISLLLSHLPLLQPRNTEAKCEYMKLLQKVLAYTTESNLYIEESRQLLSYALIHPATTLDDRNSLALWLNHLEERLSTGYSRHGTHLRQGSDEWQAPGELSMGESGHSWHEKPMRENGLMPFPSSSSVPSAIQNVGGSTGKRIRCIFCAACILCIIRYIGICHPVYADLLNPDSSSYYLVTDSL